MTTTLPTDPYKGVRDFYPKDMAIQRYIFDTWAKVAESYGYERYDASLLEPSALYKSKGAENEELVREQTYTFTDRGDREVTLRPEMTPTAARMIAGRRRELSFPVRWYSIPNLFRYERPQRGRLREHWQLNCDLFGADHAAADAEMIALAHSILRAFGATEKDFVIYVNDREMLNKYFASLALTEEQTRSMYALLDRKDKIDTFAHDAEAILGRAFDESEIASLSSDRLTACLETLTQLGITNVEYKPSIVRGFNYYTGLVFEIYDTDPQNSRALFGGGRYNNLTELFGGDSIPAFGFGMGDVTMRDFLESHELMPTLATGPRVLILTTGEATFTPALVLREALRTAAINCAVDFSTKKLSDQLAKAAKRSVPYVIIVGEDEIATGTYTLKHLDTGEEQRGNIETIIKHLS